MEQKSAPWNASRILLMVAVLAVFVAGIWQMAKFFVAEGGNPVVHIPPAPPPPVEAKPGPVEAKPGPVEAKPAP